MSGWYPAAQPNLAAEVERLQALLAVTQSALNTTRAELSTTQARLQSAELRVAQLEAERRLELIAKYGPASEQLSDAQLQLLEVEPGVSLAEVRAEAQREPLPTAPPPTQPPGRRRHPGRQSLPANLPRVDKVIPVGARTCDLWRVWPGHQPYRLRNQRTDRGFANATLSKPASQCSQ